jgi:hypothetical protein
MQSLREALLATLRHESHDRIVFQPRFMFWYSGNQVYSLTEANAGNAPSDVPRKYWGQEIIDIYDDLDASPRYAGEVLPGVGFFGTQQQPGTEIRYEMVKLPDGGHAHKMITPVGTVTERSINGYHVEYFIKSVEDLAPVQYLVEHTDFNFNPWQFEMAAEELGDRTSLAAYFTRSPLQRLILEFAGFERTVRLLRRHKQAMLDFMEALDAYSTKVFDVVCACPLEICNFGENVDANLNPPPYFEEYQLPWFRKRARQVRDAGKLSHAHFDGSIKTLLPYFAELPFDGIEAATPVPQGDVTLEELRDAFGNKVLLDGLPATLFMKEFPEEDLVACTRRLLELFSPNLVVGISDELPPNGEFARMETVSRLIHEHQL